MAEVAQQERTINYSDLVARIGAIALDQHSYAIRPFLNEVSMAEHDAGRGLITAVVVYRHGDHMPGPGFFDFARSLNYRFRDETEFLLEQLRKVYQVWSSPR